MKELNLNDIEQVSGGVSQELAIGGNLSIVAIGTAVGLAGATATAPIWFTAGLIGVSLGLTGSYISSIMGGSRSGRAGTTIQTKLHH